VTIGRGIAGAPQPAHRSRAFNIGRHQASGEGAFALGILDRTARRSNRSQSRFWAELEAGSRYGVSSSARNNPIAGMLPSKEIAMAEIKRHMRVIGKDGAYVGVVDDVESTRIKLTQLDKARGKQQNACFVERQLVGAVEGDIVKLAYNADSVPLDKA
jgi:hypothetical protein